MSISNNYFGGIVYIIKNVDFKDWLWGKFIEWRGSSINGPTAFARHLGVKQQQLSDWIAGKYQPKGAAHYPDVYRALNMPDPSSDMPSDFSQLFFTIKASIEAAGVDPESQEALKIANDMLDDFVSRRKRSS
jgi:hypothetical protein